MHPPRSFSATAPLLGALLAADAAAQQELWRVAGRVQSEQLGHAIAAVGDHDGDGVVDLLVGVPGSSQGAPAGRALLLSGRDLSLLRELAGPVGEEFGLAVAALGDLDGDGVGEHYVGSAGDPTIGGIGRIYSGATGALLHTLTGSDPTGQFGAAAVALGDVDGDGIDDFALGAPKELVGSVRAGVVRILSGSTGVELHRFDGSDASAALGGPQRMANLGDLDGDGVAELGLLDAEAGVKFPYSVVRVLSAATGTPLFSAKFDSGVRESVDLTSISALGDQDGDGVRDFVVGGVPNRPQQVQGRAFVLSGARRGSLLRIDRDVLDGWFSVGGAGDHDGDGTPDFAFSFTDSLTNDPIVELASGTDGHSLGTIVGTPAGSTGRDFVAGIDFDGDGTLDVAIGDRDAHRLGVSVGELRLQRWPSGSLIARIEGRGVDHRFKGAIAQIGDLDGDGASDFAASHATPDLSTDEVRIHSGRDGSVWRVHPVALPPFALLAVPDRDGDGLDDLAVGLGAFGVSSVDVISSVTGQTLLHLVSSSTTGGGFGAALELGIESDGSARLAVGAPSSSSGANDAGEVEVFDLVTGASLMRATGNWYAEDFGSAMAYLGDVDGDAVGDWAIGGPWHGGAGRYAGRVVVVSGASGAEVYELLGAGPREHFGLALAAMGDLDGDGVIDFAASATGATVNEGEVHFLSGATGALLRTVSGGQPNAALGSLLEATDDLNGDGVLEWIAQAASPPRHELRDGATGGRYYVAFHPSADTYVAVRAARSPVSANGDSFGDLLLIDRFAQRGITEAWMVALDDLLLHFDPPTAQAGLPIELRLGGGPAGNRCGILLVDINGLPIYQWVAIGMFDPLRQFTVTDLVPPGLSGLEYTLQGYAVGFNGRVIDTDPQLLQFE
ncbi:MAG: FG-GAP repeat protein [Planctomycetes bacterium]|nr:FG-GAP repeat protein [Planctomycetota bacterium]